MIRNYRKKKGWTQSELAVALGYESAQFISLLERNEAKVPLDVLGKLIVLIEIPESDVVEALVTQFKLEINKKLDEGKEVLSQVFPVEVTGPLEAAISLKGTAPLEATIPVAGVGSLITGTDHSDPSFDQLL